MEMAEVEKEISTSITMIVTRELTNAGPDVLRARRYDYRLSGYQTDIAGTVSFFVADQHTSDSKIKNEKK